MKLFYLAALGGLVAAVPTERKPLYDPLPEGAPNGPHIASLNEDGSTHWEFLGHLTRNSTASSEVQKRAATGAYCNGYYIGANVQSTVDDFITEFGGRYFKTAIAWQDNGAIAYGCDYGNGQYPQTSDLQNFFASIANTCGSNSAGWWSQEDWAASYGVVGSGSGYC